VLSHHIRTVDGLSVYLYKFTNTTSCSSVKVGHFPLSSPSSALIKTQASINPKYGLSFLYMQDSDKVSVTLQDDCVTNKQKIQIDCREWTDRRNTHVIKTELTG